VTQHYEPTAMPATMKVGVVGTGQVGSACAFALVMRGVAREIVLVDRTAEKAEGVATDMRYGAAISPETAIRAGDYAALAGSVMVMVTVGVNEKTGGATDRGDPKGRLRLLGKNAAIYAEIVPRIAAAAPDAIILVVSDPPDPLADIARRLAGEGQVLSAGTYLDSWRFRIHLASHLGVSPKSIEAEVLGEHGTSQVFVWSGARVSGVPVVDALKQRGIDAKDFRARIEKEVRYANITIIEGIGASQYGIGMLSARIFEMVARDERAVIPIGAFNKTYGVTLSLPSIVGHGGVLQILDPALSDEERAALGKSAEAIKRALAETAGNK